MASFLGLHGWSHAGATRGWGYSVVLYSERMVHELRTRSWIYSIRADSFKISAVNSTKCLLSMCKNKILQRLVVVGQIWDVFLKVGKRHITDTNTVSCQTASPSSKAWGCYSFPKNKPSEILCDFLSNKNIFSIASVFDIAELLYLRLWCCFFPSRKIKERIWVWRSLEI